MLTLIAAAVLGVLGIWNPVLWPVAIALFFISMLDKFIWESVYVSQKNKTIASLLEERIASKETDDNTIADLRKQLKDNFNAMEKANNNIITLQAELERLRPLVSEQSRKLGKSEAKVEHLQKEIERINE